MYGTIGHAHLKPGHEQQTQALLEEWQQTIRPKIPGGFLQLVGHAEGKTDEMVFVALAQDRPTYQALAAMPEQDAWYRRLCEHIEGDVQWNDVEMNVVERA